LGELATAAENNTDLTILLMNDGGYGVIRNIQDQDYGARRCYTELKAPSFELMARSLGIRHQLVRDLATFPAALAAAIGEPGPAIIEIDMTKAGEFGIRFAGPPKALHPQTR
ncbi:MAG: thiamine pyrophosphate-dependent enzyme, partial [Stellaceae bacterium]